MYYVIKKQASKTECFIGFKAPKFITSKSSDTVIFEFTINGKVTRKWVKKEDIILLTQDKKFFIETIEKFKKVEREQQELVDAAKKKLEESLETFTETVNSELDEFQEIKGSDDIPCILNDY